VRCSCQSNYLKKSFLAVGFRCWRTLLIN